MRLTATELPARPAGFAEWDEALSAWLVRRRVARHVTLAADSQGLPLDLDHPGHRVLLREHLHSAPHAVLVEDPDSADLGWSGGWAHGGPASTASTACCACTSPRRRRTTFPSHADRTEKSGAVDSTAPATRTAPAGGGGGGARHRKRVLGGGGL
ncbi:lantibiotic dehydratase, partial [Kitasatospora aureofaciens]